MNNLQGKIRLIMNEDISQEEKNRKIQNLYINPIKSVNIKIESCTHYNRDCSIISKCCDTKYSCRLCHDNYETHKIDRFKTTNIICNKCSRNQLVSNKCINCNIQFSKYFCSECKLWDSSDREIFHCDKCKICRVGKREDYIHCDICNGCMYKSIIDTHNCMNNTFDIDCPICKENLLNSTIPSSILECGHSIHTMCLAELCKSDYKCPLCKKRISGIDWTYYEDFIKTQVMPDEYKNDKSNILCNDCGEKSITQYHFISHKCNNCNSWNTALINIIKDKKNINN